MKICIAGLGYVGLANATILSRSETVYAYDINPERVEAVNKRHCYLHDPGVEKVFATEELDLTATCDAELAMKDARYVVVCTPSTYDTVMGSFDTSAAVEVIDLARKYAPDATIVIKSTVPVGFTQSECKRCSYDKIVFSPEFLRQDFALHDLEHPSRVVVGGSDEARWEMTSFANLMARKAEDMRVKIYLMGAGEAEAVRLFANAYLAARVAFFNELDTFACEMGLNTAEIISGISSDPRIGDHYNNPSFGYGGSRLYKDTLQLASAYQTMPSELVASVVRSNTTRKRFIAREILQRHPKVVGVYRLTMKKESESCHRAAVLDVIRQIVNRGVEVRIYEPHVSEERYLGCKVEPSLDALKRDCDLIICNRWSEELKDVEDKVYTRDNFQRD